MPDEFVTQRVDVANPPTLMLVVESLLNKIENNRNYCSTNIDDKSDNHSDSNDENSVKNKNNIKTENSENSASYNNGFCINNEKERIDNEKENKLLLSFLTDLYPALDEWVKWFLNSQKGPGNPEGNNGLYFLIVFNHDCYCILIVSLLLLLVFNCFHDC